MFETIHHFNQLLTFFVPLTPQADTDSVETWSGGTNPGGTFSYSIETINQTATESGLASPWGLPYGHTGTASAYKGDLSTPAYGWDDGSGRGTSYTNAYECAFGTDLECAQS